MSEFKAQDFDDILFPVHSLKKGMDILEIFPSLKPYREFKLPLPGAISLVKLFKFIVFAYDSKSPYVTQIDNLKERKIMAAKDAGFSTGHNTGFHSSVIDMLNCDNDSANEMIIRYLRIQGKDITGLAIDQEVYYQLNLRAIRGLSGTEDEKDKQVEVKAKLSETKDKLRVRIEDNARSFLQQETAQGLHRKLWEIAEDEAQHINLSAEDYATED